MKTKPADIPYCGVREQKIKSAQPVLNEVNIKHLDTWVRERYKIHVRKDFKKLPKPWTEDEVLKNYRFTNVKRHHDRESIYLIKTIAENDDLTLKEKLLNCILFRTWNKSSTFEYFNGPFYLSDFESFDEFLEVKAKSLSIPEKDYVWWTPAFNTGGLKGAWFSPAFTVFAGSLAGQIMVVYTYQRETYKSSYRDFKVFIKDKPHSEVELLDYPDMEKKNKTFALWEKRIPLRPFWMARWVIETGLLEQILEAETQLDIQNLLITIPGIAGFLAYQIFVDFTYCPEFKFSENEFTIAGPGCQRGLDLIFDDRDGMTYEEGLFWLRDNVNVWLTEDPMDFMEDEIPEERNISVMALENCHCEIQKYIKAKTGTGRPRVKYRPTENKKATSLF